MKDGVGALPRPCILCREASQKLQQRVHLYYERCRLKPCQAVHLVREASQKLQQRVHLKYERCRWGLARPCNLGREASQDLQQRVHLKYGRWRWGLAQAVHFGQGSQPGPAAASAFKLWKMALGPCPGRAFWAGKPARTCSSECSGFI